MYRIIGADGREYGPVTAEQIRQWVSEGRANGYSRVRLEGATEWKTLSELPEFVAAFAARPGPAAPTQSPATRGDAEALAAQILGRDYQLRIGHCIGRGWDLVMANFGLSIGATVLVYLLAMVASSTCLGSLLLNFVLWGGLRWMFLKMARGQKAELSDAFAGFSLAFVPLMLFSLVGQLLIMVGVIFCILPGIYLAVCWLLFTELLILDKRLDFWPAMELSRKVVTHHWWAAFGLALLCILLQFAGTLLCVIGYFIALPITIAATVYAYEDIFGGMAAQPAGLIPLPEPPTTTPPPPPSRTAPPPPSATASTGPIPPSGAMSSAPTPPLAPPPPDQPGTTPPPPPGSPVP